MNKPYSKLSKEIWESIEGVGKLYLDIPKTLAREWKNSKLLVIISVIILFVVAFGSFFFIRNVYSVGSSNPPISIVEEAEEPSYTGQEEDLTVNTSVQANLLLADVIINIFAPVLDGFVSSTPDVAGKQSDEIVFSYGRMETADKYSSILLSIAFPILATFLAYQGLTLIFNTRNGTASTDVQSIVQRLIISIILLFFTPYILSFSISILNTLNYAILGETSISGYLREFYDGIREAYPVVQGDNPFQQAENVVRGLIGEVGDFFNPASTIQESVEVIFAIIPIYASLLIFLFVIFQFVIRFLKLYFLAIVYPFVAIFYLNKGSQVPMNYWKEWTTSLIHQAGFVLGYRVVNDLATSILSSGGIGLEQMLIYIGGLLFLLSINLITAQIWGNAFSAISESIIAGKIGSAVTRPFAIAGGALATAGAGAIGLKGGKGIFDFGAQTRARHSASTGGEYGFAKAQSSGKTTTPFGGKLKGGFDPSATKNTVLKDATQSKSAQRMKEKGYNVTTHNAEHGVLGVEGQWVGYDHPSSGVTTLYESKDDALSDQIKDPSKLYDVNGSFNVLDTVNYNGMGSYSNETNSPILSVNAPNKEARNNLEDNLKYNIRNNIDGISTSQYPREVMEKYKGNPPKDTPRINKNFIYKDSIVTKSED